MLKLFLEVNLVKDDVSTHTRGQIQKTQKVGRICQTALATFLNSDPIEGISLGSNKVIHSLCLFNPLVQMINIFMASPLLILLFNHWRGIPNTRCTPVATFQKFKRIKKSEGLTGSQQRWHSCKHICCSVQAAVGAKVTKLLQPSARQFSFGQQCFPCFERTESVCLVPNSTYFMSRVFCSTCAIYLHPHFNLHMCGIVQRVQYCTVPNRENTDIM